MVDHRRAGRGQGRNVLAAAGSGLRGRPRAHLRQPCVCDRHGLQPLGPCTSSRIPLSDDTRIGVTNWDEDDVLDGAKTALRLLLPGQQFLYVFDLGDGWHHLCTVADSKVDPLEELGVRPQAPLPSFGWGDLPDQYGRSSVNDDEDEEVASDPLRSDLPPFFDWWGPGAVRYAH